MMVILLSCGKHLHDRLISIRGEILVHKTTLTLPLFIEMPASSQESGRIHYIFNIRNTKQNNDSNESAIPLLLFVTKRKICWSHVFIYIHIFSY
jgi:hypothetical protein